LYQVKGVRFPVVIEVPASGASLNHGDAFVLGSERYIFLWIGRGANRKEQQKAGTFLDRVKVRFLSAEFVRLDASATTPEFWETLGGETPIASEVEGGDDAKAEEDNIRKIFKAEGDQYQLVAEGLPATPSVLTGGGIFVIQRGKVIIVFLSKGFGRGDVAKGAEVGENFKVSQGLPETSRVVVVREGFASVEFDVAFE
jgi:hypothetical protein